MTGRNRVGHYVAMLGPPKHQALTQSKGYAYTPCMQGCGLLSPARLGALPALPKGFCPLGSMLVQGHDLPLGPQDSLEPPVGSREGKAFILSPAGLFGLQMGKSQQSHHPKPGAPQGWVGTAMRLSGLQHRPILNKGPGIPGSI